MAGGGDTLLAARIPYPDVVERGRAASLSLALWRNGALVAPSSGTLTILRPDGTTYLSAAAVTVTASVATYALSAPAATEPLGEGWLQLWSLTISGEPNPRVWRREMALARYALQPVVTEQDLLDEYPRLLAQVSKVADSFQPWIDAAWRQIIRALIGRGALTYLLVSNYALADWHRNLALYLVLKELYRGQPGEQWRTLMDTHKTAADAAAVSFNSTLDADHDGAPDDSSRASVATIVHVNAAPTTGRISSSRGRW